MVLSAVGERIYSKAGFSSLVTMLQLRDIGIGLDGFRVRGCEVLSRALSVQCLGFKGSRFRLSGSRPTGIHSPTLPLPPPSQRTPQKRKALLELYRNI